jgi:hypothetical protein
LAELPPAAPPPPPPAPVVSAHSQAERDLLRALAKGLPGGLR